MPDFAARAKAVFGDKIIPNAVLREREKADGVYADTSFLFPLYAQDANTAQAGRISTAFRASLALTPAAARTAQRFSAGGLPRGHDTPTMPSPADNNRNGPSDRRLADTPRRGRTYAQAETLSANHTKQLGTRGSDVLHVAAALALGVKDSTRSTPARRPRHRGGLESQAVGGPVRPGLVARFCFCWRAWVHLPMTSARVLQVLVQTSVNGHADEDNSRLISYPSPCS